MTAKGTMNPLICGDCVMKWYMYDQDLWFLKNPAGGIYTYAYTRTHASKQIRLIRLSFPPNRERKSMCVCIFWDCCKYVYI